MAELLGGLGTSHVPIIGRTMAANKQEDVPFAPFFKSFDAVHDWVGGRTVDTAIVVFNDHGLNFFLNNMPTFALGVAPSYPNGDEGWGEPRPREFMGDQALSWHLANALVEAEFDIATCGEMVLDHAAITALDLVWPDASSMPRMIIPLVINAIEPPLPSPRRCYKLGQALGDAVRSFANDRNVMIIGSGGLSHELGQSGKINEEFDRFCLDNIVGQPDRLTGYSSDDIVDLAGSQGVELMTWLVMRGALGASPSAVTSHYQRPISHTGGAMMLLEGAAAAG